ncbi:IS66 family insertion sequence element accessory protein TnpA [Paraburkholderia sp. 40]|uniref:IS66 family insertion sequence element accessory protein TnpA n=1 Tax=unclassified Paraburkholderia TaxID=2615204 RepID=UPI003D232A9F
MENTTGETVSTGTRRPRQGEAFWREMVMAWKGSGLGERRFCREQGLAVSTFGLWRKRLSSLEHEAERPLALTVDAAFVVSHAGIGAPPAVPSPTVDTSSTRDRVMLSLAGVRIELTDAHAERIVRFVLGQPGGARC